MKKIFVQYLSISLLSTIILSSCATADSCGCGNSKPYKPRKHKVSLINSEKITTFAAQKDLG
ncbi:MAG: hypothetical protein LBS25_00270 [Candidatus Symbiothrix sp.]|jgi:hypothetical protein|nr:hypothetical protein [Candidatus Symbiothrix sp.]